MSQITNVILNMGTNTEQEAKDSLQQVNSFFQDREIGFVYVNNWHTEESLHVLEVDLAVGAFNYLDLGALFKHLRTIDWRDPAGVQLLVREQDDIGFRIIDVFPEKQESYEKQEDYNVLVTEGDLRAILAAIERRRASQEKPFCLHLHIKIGSDRKLLMKNTIEELRSNMIAEMFEKGDLGNF